MVTDETLRQTLLAIPDPDEAVIQLIELAIRGGGPDNITCIVADVLDTASARGPPSEIAVVAGAVSNQGGAPAAAQDTPANRRAQAQPAARTGLPTRPRMTRRVQRPRAAAARRTRGRGAIGRRRHAPARHQTPREPPGRPMTTCRAATAALARHHVILVVLCW